MNKIDPPSCLKSINNFRFESKETLLIECINSPKLKVSQIPLNLSVDNFGLRVQQNDYGFN